MVHANDETPFAKHRGGDHWYAPLPINTGALCSLLFALCHTHLLTNASLISFTQLALSS